MSKNAVKLIYFIDNFMVSFETESKSYPHLTKFARPEHTWYPIDNENARRRRNQMRWTVISGWAYA